MENLFSFDKDKEASNTLFAIPKKGRLYEKCMKLLEGAGLDHNRPQRLDVAHCINLPVTLVFLPAADIASYVGQGNVDMGITGIDVVQEADEEVETIMSLGFGKCKLCLLAPVASGIKDPKDLAGKRIVTSFPFLTKRYFDSLESSEKNTSIKYVTGSVEAACGLGLADGVVDLVETGTTMIAAGLEIVSEVLLTEAVLVCSKSSAKREMIDLIRKRILGYITATEYMMISYNVSRENLPKALLITPGKRSPTVSSLEPHNGEEAVAVQALVKKKQSSVIMDQLELAGATDILLFTINNSRM